MYYGHVSTASNREDWQETCALIDDDTGELIDISGCRITMTLSKMQTRGMDYSYFNDYRPFNSAPILTGSTDSGEITLPETGTFHWEFDDSRMAALCAGEYQLGIRISQDDRTVQLIVGMVDIVEGIDTQ